MKKKKEFYSDNKYHTMTCSNSAKMIIPLNNYNLSTNRYKYYNMGEHITVTMFVYSICINYYIITYVYHTAWFPHIICTYAEGIE